MWSLLRISRSNLKTLANFSSLNPIPSSPFSSQLFKGWIAVFHWINHSPLDSSIDFDKTIELMFAGIVNVFWAQLRLILARAVRQGLKWAVRRAQNISMSKNINCVSVVIIIIALEGIEKIKTEIKNDNETV